MRQLTTIHDPIFRNPAHYSRLDTFFLRFIGDERNLPFVHLTLRISLLMIPVGVALYFVDGWLWWVGVVCYHYLNNIVFKGPFGLMLHCISHRPLFRKEYDLLNHYLPWIVGPFFGQTPETYFSHHIGMHHAENNMHDDRSSTLRYQRDSFRNFLIYLADFVFLGIFSLAAYFKEKKRINLMIRAVRGELLFFLLCIGLSLVDWPSTLVVFILPFLISRIIMMMGNWTQHAFLDPDDPANSFKNSVTCINTKYNHKCWNDGYHASHHVRPGMHWTEHPEYFLKNLDKYAHHKAVVFENIEFMGLFFCLMRKRYDVLASHFVNVGNIYQSDEEIIAMLKSRVQPIRS